MYMNITYQTKQQAQEVADRENMGSDYNFYYVIAVDNGFKVVAKY